MRTFLQSILAFFTLGMGTVACTKSDVHRLPRFDRRDAPCSRNALSGRLTRPGACRTRDLPWVEQQSIQTDVPTREVRFNLKDKSAWKKKKSRRAQGEELSGGHRKIAAQVRVRRLRLSVRKAPSKC